ncbi:MAG: sensor histidine kinase, partial [Synechococcaceae cyanobacterium]|nr:sensor histidine kinase [Synechococcaceae cyanobacterium]
MELLLAALVGAALALLLTARPGGRGGRRAGPSAGQLLAWIDEAPTGWLLLDGEDRIQRINARAERQLHRPVGGVAPGDDLAEACPAPELRDLVQEARRRGRSQRLEWQLGEQELELFALPADSGWVALLLLDRRSLEAQLEQQERWVSDVAHELRTPLTALLLVGDTLAA